MDNIQTSASDVKPDDTGEHRKTQRSRILKILVLARGGWVPMPVLQRVAAMYVTRVHELRKLGFKIENKVIVVSGQRHSSYRLLSGSGQIAKPADTPASTPKIAAASETVS